jgi:hypothetical protein
VSLFTVRQQQELARKTAPVWTERGFARVRVAAESDRYEREAERIEIDIVGPDGELAGALSCQRRQTGGDALDVTGARAPSRDGAAFAKAPSTLGARSAEAVAAAAGFGDVEIAEWPKVQTARVVETVHHDPPCAGRRAQ